MENNVRRLIKFLFAVIALVISGYSAAESQTDVVSSTSIIIAPVVREHLHKLSSGERKRQEEAVRVGNSYVPYHYDGIPYRDTFTQSEKVLWKNKIRPLIDRDLRAWYSFSDIEGVQDIKIDGIPNGKSPGLLVVCPQIELMSVTPASEHYDIGWKTILPLSFSEDSFELQYRTKIIGALDDSGISPYFKYFLPINNDEYAIVLISLNKDLKVSRVLNKYIPMTLTSDASIALVESFVTGVMSHDLPSAEKNRLKSLIMKIRNVESKTCVGNVSTIQ
jgi:hypothetical protein